jgi:hypothetical protein
MTPLRYHRITQHDLPRQTKLTAHNHSNPNDRTMNAPWDAEAGFEFDSHGPIYPFGKWNSQNKREVSLRRGQRDDAPR